MQCSPGPSTKPISWLGQPSLTQKFTEINGETQHLRQDGADPKPGQETRRKHQSYPVCCLEYLFSVLEFTDWSCMEETWQPEPSAKLCYFGCIRTPEINPKNPARLSCSCRSLLELSPSKRSGWAWTGRAAAALARKAILCQEHRVPGSPLTLHPPHTSVTHWIQRIQFWITPAWKKGKIQQVCWEPKKKLPKVGFLWVVTMIYVPSLKHELKASSISQLDRSILGSTSRQGCFVG